MIDEDGFQVVQRGGKH
jgi:hypothetical protein